MWGEGSMGGDILGKNNNKKNIFQKWLRIDYIKNIFMSDNFLVSYSWFFIILFIWLLIISFNEYFLRINFIFYFYNLEKINKINDLFINILISFLTIIIPLIVIPVENIGKENGFLKDLFIKEANFYSFIGFVFLLIVFNLILYLNLFQLIIIISSLINLTLLLELFSYLMHYKKNIIGKIFNLFLFIIFLVILIILMSFINNVFLYFYFLRSMNSVNLENIQSIIQYLIISFFIFIPLIKYGGKFIRVSGNIYKNIIEIFKSKTNENNTSILLLALLVFLCTENIIIFLYSNNTANEEFYIFIFSFISMIFLFSKLYNLIDVLININKNQKQYELVIKYLPDYERTFLADELKNNLLQIIDYIDSVLDERSKKENDILLSFQKICKSNKYINTKIINSFKEIINNQENNINNIDSLKIFGFIYNIDSRNLLFQINNKIINLMENGNKEEIYKWLELIWKNSKNKSELYLVFDDLFKKIISFNVPTLYHKEIQEKTIYNLISLFLEDINNLKEKNELTENDIEILGTISLLTCDYYKIFFNEEVMDDQNSIQNTFIKELLYLDLLNDSYRTWNVIFKNLYNDQNIFAIKFLLHLKYKFMVFDNQRDKISLSIPLNVLNHCFIRKFEGLNDQNDNQIFKLFKIDIEKSFNQLSFLLMMFNELMYFSNDDREFIKNKNKKNDFDIYRIDIENDVSNISEYLFTILIVIFIKNEQSSLLNILNECSKPTDRDNKSLLFYLLKFKNDTEMYHPKHEGLDFYINNFKEKIIEFFNIDEKILDEWIEFTKPENEEVLKVWVESFILQC